MSKPKYFILNGDNFLGTFWETEKLGNVLVIQDKIDLNNPIQIIAESDTGVWSKIIKNIDMIETFMEILDIVKTEKE